MLFDSRSSCSESPIQTDLADAVFAMLGIDDDSTICDAPKPGSNTTHTGTSEAPWILSIDDDEAFTYGLKLRLNGVGVELERAFTGMEGYNKAFSSPATSILLDYEMPNGNGAYILRRLKESPITRDIPVLVLTGRNDNELKQRMFSLGAKSFHTKPYDWDKLWGELKSYVNPQLLTLA